MNDDFIDSSSKMSVNLGNHADRETATKALWKQKIGEGHQGLSLLKIGEFAAGERAKGGPPGRKGVAKFLEGSRAQATGMTVLQRGHFKPILKSSTQRPKSGCWFAGNNRHPLPHFKALFNPSYVDDRFPGSALAGCGKTLKHGKKRTSEAKAPTHSQRLSGTSELVPFPILQT